MVGESDSNPTCPFYQSEVVAATPPEGASSARSWATVARFDALVREFNTHRNRINLSQVFAGQRVGIKEVDEGIWIVSFMHYDLGYIELEQKTLQPLDNPFGARS